MPSRARFEPDRMTKTAPLGAVELTSYAAVAANDNGGAVAGPPTYGLRKPLLPSPLVAFAGGLAVALLVAGIGQWLGVTS